MNQLKFELERCIKLYNLDILQSSDELCQSALIEILIRLNYILQSLDKQKKRVVWKDDIKNGDITNLVNDMRNAACHTESYLNKIRTSTLLFNKFLGHVPNAIKIGNISVGSNYADDIAFNYGDKIIYLKRHIGRLITELQCII